MSLNLNTRRPACSISPGMLSAEALTSNTRQVYGVQHLLFGPPETLLLSARFSAEWPAEYQSDFNELLTNTLAGFTSAAGARTREVETALRLVCEFTGLDGVALWSCSNETDESFRWMHGYASGLLWHNGVKTTSNTVPDNSAKPCQELPKRVAINSSRGFPWMSAQVRAGKALFLSDLVQLPAEAARDKEMLTALGIHACAVIPLVAEGKVIGAASFTCSVDGFSWSDVLVQRLKLVTQVFGVGLMQDIRGKELRKTARELAGLKAALDEHAILVITDLQGRIAYVNDKCCTVSKYSREELVGQHYSFLNSGHHSKEFFSEMWAGISQGQVWRGEIRNRAKDGTFYWESTTILPLLNEQGRPCQYLSIRADITERKIAEEALRKSYSDIRELKDRLEVESAYLQNEIRVIHPHGQIIGHSAGIKRVLHQAEQVAAADCPVLLSGETGTGKELIAQEIHRLSQRRDRLMIMVNCAALPSALVESELFGRERGAYTGALTAQVGRFQVADGSTIFLDEVGELSLEVQAKLLRVLQQGEFQRLGNPKTHRVNVRVIAATNRDLAEEVRQGRFREDLYYRLKVFPIDLPPLRQRVDDIPALVFAFLEEFSTRMGKKITKVPRTAMEKMKTHSWPGNIRELRNVIEHSVILTIGDVLKLSTLSDTPVRQTGPITLAEAEREHIIKALEITNWRIKGTHGAAKRLGLEPSTLYSRMQKLGIPNRRQKDDMAAGITC